MLSFLSSALCQHKADASTIILDYKTKPAAIFSIPSVRTQSESNRSIHKAGHFGELPHEERHVSVVDFGVLTFVPVSSRGTRAAR